MQKGHFETVIAQMEQTFDSHVFIECYKRMYKSEYNRLCEHYSHTQDPIQTVHAPIARNLSRYAKELYICADGDNPSMNGRGNRTPCKKWKKL